MLAYTILRFVNQPLRYTSRYQHTLANVSTLAAKNPGEEVKIRGWVQNVRKMKRNIFADISDGSCCHNIQVVLSKDSCSADLMGVGDSVEINGLLGLTPKNELEIHAQDIKIIGKCKLLEGYPFTPKQSHPPEYVREYLHLRSKVGYMRSAFRVRHKVVKLIHEFMDEAGLVNIHTPILTRNDCEGAGEVFTVKPDNKELLQQMVKPDVSLENAFFDKKVFLSVSGQLCLEAMSHGLGDVYTLSPTFRAENSRSNLHLSEFYMLEVELAFVSDLEKVTSFIEKSIKTITEKLLHCCEDDLKKCLPDSKEQPSQDFSWLQKQWPIVTYEEAYEILSKQKNKLTTTLELNGGFSKEQELLLVKYFDSPVFVVNWPKVMKPFYMKEIISDPTKVFAMDLLMPGVGELVGGSLREDNYDRLKEALPEGLEWYLELRKFGGIPTGGFGLGLERYLQLITGIRNIRDVIPFPRYPHSCLM